MLHLFVKHNDKASKILDEINLKLFYNSRFIYYIDHHYEIKANSLDIKTYYRI